MGRVTRKDVAAKAGVSETVVSYVLNHNRYVDAGKRKRVMDAVGSLGYVPSPMARALKGKGSGQILLVVDHLESDHFVSLVSKMEGLASREGLVVSLCRWRAGERFVQGILTHGYDGVLVGSCEMTDEAVQELIDSGLPVVVLETKKRPALKGRYGIINSGLYQGGRELMDLFHQEGCRSIAYVGSLGPNVEDDERYRAYLDCLEGQEPRTTKMASSDQELAGRVRELWQQKSVDGLFCRTDYVACIAMRELQALGVKVPGQVKVSGFDDAWCGRYATPLLTTQRIRRDLMAQEAMKMFGTLRSGKENQPLRADLRTEMQKRESL